MSAKPATVKLSEMQPNQLGDFFALLCEKTLRTTKAGKPFFSVQFRDRHRTATAPIWNDNPLFEPFNRDWKPGQHFKIRAVYREHEQFGPQIEIQQIRLATPEDWTEGYDPDGFVQSTRFDADELFRELLEAAESISDKPFRELVCGLLKTHKAAICRQPAATHNHHAFRGGFLEHTVSVVRTGIYLADKYRAYYPDLQPPLNRDLVVAGCILHDIGKLVELEAENDMIRYTVPGVLIGHILIGRDMVREAAREIEGLNPELTLMLEHIIVSHQGTAEWGSPKPPMFPEALLVHHADDLDAKFAMMVQAIESAEGESPFTEQKNPLGRKLLRQRTV